MTQMCDGFSTNFTARSRLGSGSGAARDRHMAGRADGAALDTAWLPAGRRGSAVPTALVLHGGRGLFGDGDAVLPARALVASGLNILLVRGFGAPAIDPDGHLAEGGLEPCVARVAGLIDRLAGLANDDRPSAFGVVGISVGGTVALELAAADVRIRAVASCFAPSYEGARARAAHAPAALILHGRADAAVPVGRAADLEASLRSRGAHVERVEYEDEGHGFTGPAQLDAVRRIGEFLLARLGATDGPLRAA